MDAAINNSSRQINLAPHAPAFEAYSSFKDQFDKLQGPAQTRAATAETQVSESQLDKLSIVWLAEQNSALGRDVTRADLNAPQPSELDSLMAAHVSKQYEAIQHAHFDPEGGFLLLGSHEKDALTRKDIDATLKSVEKERQSMDYADPLMSDNGALFYRLSNVHDGVRSVNYWDLKDARSIDDYEHSRGTQLFTQEQRNLIDKMYHRWSKGDMSAIEERPQGSTMGCDGAITADTLAKGTGFRSVREMISTFNPAATSESGDAEAARQDAIIQNARKAWEASQQDVQARSTYAVQPGDGFDKIARHVMTNENGSAPAEPDVINYSKSIAQMNGYDRDSYDPKSRSLQPGQSIQVHDSDWQQGQLLDAAGKIDDSVRQQIDNPQQ